MSPDAVVFMDESSPKEAGKLIESVDKALCLLECFSDAHSELTLKELSDKTGLNKSRILRLCGTLTMHGFLVRRRGSLYSLGPALMMLGKVYERSNNLISLARPIMKDLALLTGESVKLFVIEGKKRICLARELGPSRLHYAIREGEELSLLAGAGGKVLLAYASPQFREEVLTQGLERVTPATIVKREQLMEELDKVRKQGYAISNGELVYEVGGVAAPVFNNAGEVTGALTVAGPIQRFTDELCRAKLRDLLDATRKLSYMLGHDGGDAMRPTGT
jgi:DNA-binding IclR family transcriptional regulator